MSKDPFVVAWTVRTDSPGTLRHVAEVIEPLTNLSSAFIDHPVTSSDRNEVVREERHEFRDYFDRLCVLPGGNGGLPCLRLFFQRKSGAGRFWKDVMAYVLREVKQASHEEASIALDYRVDDKEVYAAAMQLPKWFSRLGPESRRFWRISAHYLVKHPSFTFSDLEKFSRIPSGSLKAIHRNSYRSIKREQLGDPLHARWDSTLKRNVYQMEPLIRDQILCLTKDDSGPGDASEARE